MSRFNQVSQGIKTTNYAGGKAYTQSPELELVSILLTSFTNDQFYRSADDTFDRLKELIKYCDKKFVAKAAIFARTRFGMRSISHVVAAELAEHISREEWAKDFYKQIIYRPDDMLEIISYYFANKGEKLSNAIKKGFAKAFDKFDNYQLAKYRGENKQVKLIDVVNLVHPKPTEKNEEALSLLVKNQLKSFDTWESELVRAGQAAESEEEKQELKKEVWVKLIREKKIGYFALLRNLRNIIKQAPEIVQEAIQLLTDENLIKNSLVLPFRFVTAYDEIEQLTEPNGVVIRDVLMALNQALDISLNNIPKFDGRTLVALDTSGSMKGNPAKIGSLFAAVLIKSNNADLIMFSDEARYKNVNPIDSTMTIAKRLRFADGGTNFKDIFRVAKGKYDRIIILSDMQGWIGYDTPVREFRNYCERFKANPFVYSFDLNSYGTMQFPEDRVFCIAGFSEKVFDIMKLLEQDKHALINEIKKIEL